MAAPTLPDLLAAFDAARTHIGEHVRLWESRARDDVTSEQYDQLKSDGRRLLGPQLDFAQWTFAVEMDEAERSLLSKMAARAMIQTIFDGGSLLGLELGQAGDQAERAARRACRALSLARTIAESHPRSDRFPGGPGSMEGIMADPSSATEVNMGLAVVVPRAKPLGARLLETSALALRAAFRMGQPLARPDRFAPLAAAYPDLEAQGLFADFHALTAAQAALAEPSSSLAACAAARERLSQSFPSGGSDAGSRSQLKDLLNHQSDEPSWASAHLASLREALAIGAGVARAPCDPAPPAAKPRL